MTPAKLAALPVGTRLMWTRPGDRVMYGTIVQQPEQNYRAPHYMIEWEDGQRTDGRDDAALQYVLEP